MECLKLTQKHILHIIFEYVTYLYNQLEYNVIFIGSY